MATRLRELTSDSQRFDRLVSGASKVYDEKERLFESPLMVGYLLRALAIFTSFMNIFSPNREFKN